MATATVKFTLAHKSYRRDIAMWSHGKAHRLPGFTQKDLEQEMTLVLWKAVQTYDPDNGSKFANYFRVLRDRRWADLLKAAGRAMRQSEANWVPLDYEPGEEDFRITEFIALDSDVLRAMEKAHTDELLRECSAEEEALAIFAVEEKRGTLRGRRSR